MHMTSHGRRATAVTAVLAAGTLALGACGSSVSAGPSGKNAAAEAPSVAAVIKGLDNPFFQTMKQGMDEQAKAGGLSLTVQAADSITDTTGQADKLNGLAGQP